MDIFTTYFPDERFHVSLKTLANIYRDPVQTEEEEWMTSYICDELSKVSSELQGVDMGLKDVIRYAEVAELFNESMLDLPEMKMKNGELSVKSCTDSDATISFVQENCEMDITVGNSGLYRAAIGHIDDGQFVEELEMSVDDLGTSRNKDAVFRTFLGALDLAIKNICEKDSIHAVIEDSKVAFPNVKFSAPEELEKSVEKKDKKKDNRNEWLKSEL